MVCTLIRSRWFETGAERQAQGKTVATTTRPDRELGPLRR